MRLKSRWGCQNHPFAKIATSLEGLVGVVGISGQILSMLEAKRGKNLSLQLKGGKDAEKSACVEKKTKASVVLDAISYFRGGVVSMELILILVLW